MPLIRSSNDALPFGSVDLTDTLSRLQQATKSKLVVWGGGDHLWALLSITNNDTQQVTIISPQ